jgi:hypothetical protein
MFATWLVFKVESLQPSDFGRFKSVFEPVEAKPKNVPQYDKHYLKMLADDYKSGRLDSAMFDLQLDRFIVDASKKASAGK